MTNVGQCKFVSNYWYQTMSLDNVPMYSANVAYTHLDDESHIDHYNVYEPRWVSTLEGLSYAPLTGAWITFGSGHITGVGQHIYTNFSSDPHTHSNQVHLIHTRAAIRSPSAQPWQVSRLFLKYKYERSLPSGQPDITPEGFHTLAIDKDQAVSNTVALEPAVSQNVERYEFLTDFQFTPTTPMQLGVDESVQPPWLMLPLNASRSFKVKSAASTAIPIRFYPAGIGMQQAQVVSQEFGTLTFTATTEGDITNLVVGVGNDNAQNGGAAKMAVYPRQTVKLALHPIACPGPNGTPVTPHNIPDPFELQEYLNLVIGTQTNVMFEVTLKEQVTVNYDVGVGKEGLSPEMIRQGADLEGKFNKSLDICWNTHNSDEEKVILQASPPDPAFLVNVYYVASQIGSPLRFLEPKNLPNGSPHWGWEPKDVTALGVARKARPQNHGTLWVAGMINYVENGLPTEPHARWTIAHEVVHYIGNVYHCSDPADHFYIPNSDNELRLMTDLAGPKRATSPPRMVKGEWDKIVRTVKQLLGGAE